MALGRSAARARVPARRRGPRPGRRRFGPRGRRGALLPAGGQRVVRTARREDWRAARHARSPARREEPARRASDDLPARAARSGAGRARPARGESGTQAAALTACPHRALDGVGRRRSEESSQPSAVAALPRARRSVGRLKRARWDAEGGRRGEQAASRAEARRGVPSSTTSSGPRIRNSMSLARP